MKEHRKIEQQVNEAMDSLDGMSRAKANPFLFTRVEARLRPNNPKNAWETILSYVSRPAVALAMLCMVVLSNGVVMFWQSGPPEPAITADQPVPLTDEYNMNVLAFYDDENPEQ